LELALERMVGGVWWGRFTTEGTEGTEKIWIGGREESLRERREEEKFGSPHPGPLPSEWEREEDKKGGRGKGRGREERKMKREGLEREIQEWGALTPALSHQNGRGRKIRKEEEEEKKDSLRRCVTHPRPPKVRGRRKTCRRKPHQYGTGVP